jgi:hypothetical protein
MSTTRSGLLTRAVTTLAAAAALVATQGAATSATAADAPTGAAERAGLAGSFIAATLVGGDHYDYPDSEYFDGGNTIDAVLALDGAGVGHDTADAAMAYLAANVGVYTGADYGSTYSGATAKTLLAVAVHGGDPTSFGGVDLVAALQDGYGATDPGRYSDLPTTGCGYTVCDYSNTIGQSLAIIALGRAGSPAPAEATDFLLDQQCADGGFRGDPAATTCESDPDATAFAAQALLHVGATAEAAAALDHLAGLQSAGGGVAGDGVAENANSTGVAVQAFLAGGRTAAAAAGQGFLASLQYDCTAAEALRWGVAYTPDTRSTATVQDSDLRATPQAALALAGGSLLTVTSAGAAAGLPQHACAAPATSTPTTSAPATSTGTSSATATTSSTPVTSAPVTSAPVASAPAATTTTTAGTSAPPRPSSSTTAVASTGALAQTGSNLLVPVLVGVALVVLGAVAVRGSRRRGAHD